MAEKDIQRFTFDGSEVIASFVELGGDHEELLANYLERDQPQPGSARVATVVAALSDRRGGSLKIDGRKINFMNKNKPFPKKREGTKSLLHALLEYIITVREPWLAEGDLSQWFADYLVEPEDLVDGLGPTGGRSMAIVDGDD